MSDIVNWPVRVVEWLRAGYPQGVPRQDYVALLGVLRRALTEHEVRSIADELALVAGGEPITADEIAEMIEQSVLQKASPEDLVRVSARLAAGGWPLAGDPREEAVR